MSNPALGKGLSALISDDTMNELNQAFFPAMDVARISPNPYQPRVEIADADLSDLAESIKEHGVIEPLIVTRKKNTDDYELIAGERRLKASKLAGLSVIPVVVKEASPQQMLELAVVENIQRADLNPLEEGMAFEQLAKEFNMTHNEISLKIGVSRPAVANKIRLLQLPDEIKQGLLQKLVDEGHARALLGLTNQEIMMQAYRILLRDKLSVRAVEELVRRLNQGHRKPKRATERIIDDKTISIERELRKKFTPKLTLSRSKKGGKIVIPFTNDNELDKIYSKLLTN